MIKYILTTFLVFYSSVLLANPSEESFHLSCKAEQSRSEESLQANAELTITQRPALGGGFTFDYRILANPLPYQAKVEYDFGETRYDDSFCASPALDQPPTGRLICWKF